MKRFETPILKLEKFDLVNIITASGDVQPEEKAQAVDLAAANFTDGTATVAQTFTITL